LPASARQKSPNRFIRVGLFLFGWFLCDFSNERLGVQGIVLSEKKQPAVAVST